MATPSVYDVESYTATASTADYTVTLPSHASGDLLFGVFTANYGAGGDFVLTTATGWTSVAHVTDNYGFYNTSRIMSVVFYKFATSSSETAPHLTVDMSNFSEYSVDIFSIRNVDSVKWTKGAASVIRQIKGTSGTYSQSNLNPEAQNCLLIQSFIELDRPTSTVAISNANSWTNVSTTTHDGFSATLNYKTIDTLGLVTGPSLTCTCTKGGVFNTFVFIGTDEKLYSQIRFVADDTATLGTTASINPITTDKYAFHFTYSTTCCWALLNNRGNVFTDTDNGVTAPTDRTWYNYGTSRAALATPFFFVAPAATDDSTTSFTVVFNSTTATVSLFCLVGVNVNQPISNFQQRRPSGSLESDYTPLSCFSRKYNTHVICLIDTTTISGNSASSGYTKFDYSVLLFAYKNCTTDTNTDGYISYTESYRANLYGQSFVLNSYENNVKICEPNARCVVRHVVSTTGTNTIYNVPIKAGSLVLFFVSTATTTSAINLATSLGTPTSLGTEYDTTNGWNHAIYALKITSDVTTDWTITQSLPSSGSKYDMIAIVENLPNDVENVMYFEAVDNDGTNNSLDFTIAPGRLNLCVATNKFATSWSASSWSWFDESGVSSPNNAFEISFSPSATTSFVASADSKMFIHGVSLPGWSLGNSLFFGTPF